MTRAPVVNRNRSIGNGDRLLRHAAIQRHDVVAHDLAFDPADAVDFWDLTNRQDWELSDRAQAGIASAGYRPGPYSHREDMLIAFDRWVVARAGTLDSGA